MRLPGELHDPLVDDCDALAEQLRRKLDLLHDLPGFELHFPQRGPPDQSCPFVKEAAPVFQTLRESVPIMWVSLDDLVAVLRRGRDQDERSQGRQEDHAPVPLLAISSAISTTTF